MPDRLSKLKELSCPLGLNTKKCKGIQSIKDIHIKSMVCVSNTCYDNLIDLALEKDGFSNIHNHQKIKSNTRPKPRPKPRPKTRSKPKPKKRVRKTVKKT